MMGSRPAEVSALYATPQHAPLDASNAGTEAEALLVTTVIEIGNSRLVTALTEIDKVIQTYPNFRLAHLIKGDLLLARAKPLTSFGNTGHAAQERLEDLRDEVRARLHAIRARPPQDRIPRYLLQLDPSQKYAIVVDSNRSRLYLYENSDAGPRLVSDYYTTLGKRGMTKEREGDLKTPVGVYFVTSSIPGSKLPDLYGAGAFPINYPNEWDRMLGRNGFGIWLHGVPSDTYSRPPWTSDGCLALANPDFIELGRSVQPGVTPVIIAEEVQWAAEQGLRAEREEFMRRLEAWRVDWESRDTDRYLTHYAKKFHAGSKDLEGWSEHKRRMNAAKAWIKIRLANLSFFRGPGKDDLVVVTFDQDYRSDKFTQKTRKRQYWVRENGQWKIAYEGPVRAGSVALPESFPGSRG